MFSLRIISSLLLFIISIHIKKGENKKKTQNI